MKKDDTVLFEDLEEIAPPSDKCDEIPLDVPGLTEAEKQNKQFTEILDAAKQYYLTKNRHNPVLKIVFFCAAVFVLVVITVSFVVAFFMMIRLDNWQVALPVMGGGAITIVTALLKLPEIIAKYLFPLNEDKTILELISKLKDK